MSAESNSRCPVCRTADVVCGKWTLLVIRDLATGSSRFCELERSLAGISPRTLSLRLRALEEEGIVARRRSDSVRGLIPSSERSSSQKRLQPSARSRMTSNVHLPQTTSAVRQTGHRELLSALIWLLRDEPG